MSAVFQSRGVAIPHFPEPHRARINNTRISLPPFRLSSTPPAPESTHRRLPTEISTLGDFRVGASNIKQPRFRTATYLGDRGEGEERAVARLLLKNFETASELVSNP